MPDFVPISMFATLQVPLRPPLDQPLAQRARGSCLVLTSRRATPFVLWFVLAVSSFVLPSTLCLYAHSPPELSSASGLLSSLPLCVFTFFHCLQHASAQTDAERSRHQLRTGAGPGPRVHSSERVASLPSRTKPTRLHAIGSRATIWTSTSRSVTQVLPRPTGCLGIGSCASCCFRFETPMCTVA